MLLLVTTIVTFVFIAALLTAPFPIATIMVLLIFAMFYLLIGRMWAIELGVIQY